MAFVREYAIIIFLFRVLLFLLFNGLKNGRLWEGAWGKTVDYMVQGEE